jgi:hypothetical protein
MLNPEGSEDFTYNFFAEPFRTPRLTAAIVPSSGYNLRATTQFSVMTLSPTPNQAQQDMLSRGYPASIIFRIAHLHKQSTRAALSVLGWTRRHVFADVEHAALDFREWKRET